MKKILYLFIAIILLTIGFISGYEYKNYINKEIKEINLCSKTIEHFVQKENITDKKEEEISINELSKINSNKEKSDEEILDNIIDIEYNECINNSNIFEFANCAYYAGERWKNETFKYLKILENTMTKEDFEDIKNSQKQWNIYAKTDTVIINKFITNKEGIINGTSGLTHIMEIYKQRALFLQAIQFYYNEDIKLKEI